MKKKITIVDYGMGNVFSAKQSCIKVVEENKIAAEVSISNNPNEIIKSSHVILPGQGAFGSCIQGLKKIKGMINALEEFAIKDKKPFLGICVGMQLLANVGYENGEHVGLGWIDGSIKKIENKKLKLPHMGWNNVEIVNSSYKIKLTGENSDFYFVHSYFFDCHNKNNIVGITKYGLTFASIVAKENIYGVQFHPEKSSEQGLELIKKFLLL